MTKTPTAASSSSPKSSKRSAFVAKCSAPFLSKQRSPVEHEIHLDEPFRQYFPGDTVRGAVHLSFAKALRVTHLVVRLHGFVKVINNAKHPGETITYDEILLATKRGRARRGIEYFGDGFARLFEDEYVLCGEGRVAGPYEFRFEMGLPKKDVPSSIDFEHGTISYLLTSVLTRPITVAPTSTCHRKLSFTENIDVASVPKPKIHTIRIETVGKRAKGKTSARKTRTGERKASDSSSRASGNVTQSGSSTGPRISNEDPPRSPVPSEISSASITSSIKSCTRTDSGILPTTNEQGDVVSGTDNIIIAKTEVLQGGCLPGDSLPLRISVKHTRAIKNMHGMIITLYRQGRIDSYPAIPIGPLRSGTKAEYEDYYPKSRSGLGGLSLSSAGSSRSFRQDLAQSMPPLIVDPHSLTAVINTSIAIPLDLFPTITCVPGAMISFRYFVEIVIDLRGRPGGQDIIRSHLSMTSGLQHGYGDPKISKIEGVNGVNYSSAPGFNYLITDQLRRTKGVVFTLNEIIVGTKDSAHRRVKGREIRRDLDDGSSFRDSEVLGVEQHSQTPTVDQQRPSDGSEARDLAQRPVNELASIHTMIMPPLEVEEDLDEKAMIRRAEQRLLPSAPPEDDDPSSGLVPVPTAPPAADEEDFIRRYALRAPAPAYDGPSASSPETILPAREPEEDKQELERQRLLALASSPDVDDDRDGDDAAVSTSHAFLPSAPILFQDDLFSINDPRVPYNSVGPAAGDVNARQRSSTPEAAVDSSEPEDSVVHHQDPESADPLTDEHNDVPSHELPSPTIPQSIDHAPQASHTPPYSHDHDINDRLPA